MQRSKPRGKPYSHQPIHTRVNSKPNNSTGLYRPTRRVINPFRMSSNNTPSSTPITPTVNTTTKSQPKQPKQQNPPKSKGKSSKKRDLLSVYNDRFPQGTVEYVDTHCHLDYILTRLNQQEENTKAKAEPTPAAETENTDGQESTAPSLQESAEKTLGWTMNRLNTESHIGNWDGCVTICCELDSFDPVLSIIDNDKTGKIFAGFGIHPHEASTWTQEVEDKFVKIMKHPKVIAWGECGLDYYYDNSPRDIQRKVFVRQLELCVEAKKPLIVHTREAEEDTVELMTKHLPADWPIHIHCCTSTGAMVTPLLKHFKNLYVGFTGCITFPNAQAIRDTLSLVPIERLLLETDGPFMAPVPFRGSVAHSGMIPFIALKMAEVKGVPVEELMKQVRENTRVLYGF